MKSRTSSFPTFLTFSSRADFSSITLLDCALAGPHPWNTKIAPHQGRSTDKRNPEKLIGLRFTGNAENSIVAEILLCFKSSSLNPFLR